MDAAERVWMPCRREGQSPIALQQKKVSDTDALSTHFARGIDARRDETTLARRARARFGNAERGQIYATLTRLRRFHLPDADAKRLALAGAGDSSSKNASTATRNARLTL